MLDLFGHVRSWRLYLFIITLVAVVQSLELDVTDETSIRTAAQTVVNDLLYYYTGDQPGGTPGQLPYPPYYWWESGGMWGALIGYWHYTGDDSYNDMISQALLFQTGPDNDYEPLNQTFDLGNDDQAFWGMSAMAAAEYNFPNPPEGSPSWLSLAQAVFNRQTARWDNATCGGGLRWQIFPTSSGYDYKNSVSNGALFNIASRLARYTDNTNTTYLNWANTIWDWENAIGLIQVSAGNKYEIYDGTTPSQNCSSIDHLQWSYETGLHLYGAAILWNLTQDTTWQQRVLGLLDSTDLYFRSNDANTTDYVLWEIECEGQGNCDTDQLSFKSYLARWMWKTVEVAPFTYDYVLPRMQASAQAAAQSCTGGTNGTQCGMRWYEDAYDGNPGPGQQMDALEVMQGLMNQFGSSGVVSNQTGGTSVGNPHAGTGSSSASDTPSNILNITAGDRAGAWILTVFLILGTLGAAVWAAMPFSLK